MHNLSGQVCLLAYLWAVWNAQKDRHLQPLTLLRTGQITANSLGKLDMLFMLRIQSACALLNFRLGEAWKQPLTLCAWLRAIILLVKGTNCIEKMHLCSFRPVCCSYCDFLKEHRLHISSILLQNRSRHPQETLRYNLHL